MIGTAGETRFDRRPRMEVVFGPRPFPGVRVTGIWPPLDKISLPCGLTKPGGSDILILKSSVRQGLLNRGGGSGNRESIPHDVRVSGLCGGSEPMINGVSGT